jgi:uncharacterized membrane protein (UPF0136 family)
MQTMAWILWVYGALVLVGGVLGFVKARSLPSLLSGAGFGIAFIVLGVGVLQAKSPAALWAGVLAGVLAVVMGVRFAKTKKFMPAGLIAVLSVVVVLAFLLLR